MLRNALIYALAGVLLMAGVWLSRFTLSHHLGNSEWLLALGAGIILTVGVWVGLRERRKSKAAQKASEQPSTGFPSESLPAAMPLAELTPREAEVLQLLARGMSNQQIADELFVSLNTVKTHTAKLYLKLEVPNRTSAIVKARSLGLLG
jgi:NarL family two-component system response regulator LiaR